jgi:peptide/nickel transport system permease protein
MILDGRPVLTSAPWESLFPGLAIVITVLAVNLVGDALRGALYPRSA